MVVRVIANPRVYTLTRAQTVYNVICEFVEGITEFKAPELIRRGIVEKPYLRAVHILLVNQQREKIAELSMTIDWEKHQVFASTSGMDLLQFDAELSVSEQLSQALVELKNFVVALKDNIVKAEIWYSIRSDLDISYEDACETLGLSRGKTKQLEWAKGKYISAKFMAARLEELHLNLRAKVE